MILKRILGYAIYDGLHSENTRNAHKHNKNIKNSMKPTY